MKYRKKPVVIDAVLWTGDNIGEILRFLGKSGELFIPDQLYIETPEGRMKASAGDYIIKGVSGEFYPCEPDIFLKTYEAVIE